MRGQWTGEDEFEAYTNICPRKCISKLRVIKLLHLQRKTNQRIQIDGKHSTCWEFPGSLIMSMENRRDNSPHISCLHSLYNQQFPWCLKTTTTTPTCIMLIQPYSHFSKVKAQKQKFKAIKIVNINKLKSNMKAN